MMLILTVFLMKRGVIGEMKLTAGPNLPNIFLVDISSRELNGVKHLLAQQPAVEGDVETLPSVAGRLGGQLSHIGPKAGAGAQGRVERVCLHLIAVGPALTIGSRANLPVPWLAALPPPSIRDG
jgi:hypothetical protein